MVRVRLSGECRDVRGADGSCGPPECFAPSELARMAPDHDQAWDGVYGVVEEDQSADLDQTHPYLVRCDFSVPKDATRAQLLDAEANRQRLLLEIPLTETERAAVEDGTTAVEQLLERLADTPTPAGPTPRELHASFIPLDALDSQPRRPGHHDAS